MLEWLETFVRNDVNPLQPTPPRPCRQLREQQGLQLLQLWEEGRTLPPCSENLSSAPGAVTYQLCDNQQITTISLGLSFHQ